MNPDLALAYERRQAQLAQFAANEERHVTAGLGGPVSSIESTRRLLNNVIDEPTGQRISLNTASAKRRQPVSCQLCKTLSGRPDKLRTHYYTAHGLDETSAAAIILALQNLDLEDHP